MTLYVVYLTATHKNVADINVWQHEFFRFRKTLKLYCNQVKLGH